MGRIASGPHKELAGIPIAPDLWILTVLAAKSRKQSLGNNHLWHRHEFSRSLLIGPYNSNFVS